MECGYCQQLNSNLNLSDATCNQEMQLIGIEGANRARSPKGSVTLYSLGFKNSKYMKTLIYGLAVALMYLIFWLSSKLKERRNDT